jgi:hypothetical protein
MLRAMVSRSIRRSAAFIVAIWCIAACAKSGNTPPSDSLSTGDDSGVGTSSGGADGTGGRDGSLPNTGDDGPSFVAPDSTAKGDACQEFAVNFIPKVPLVYVLADRSGSMFSPIPAADGGTTNQWIPLRTAALAVINGLQDQVAFGFGAYTGINPNTQANMCPILDTVPIALHNYKPIETLYNTLGQAAFKAETPAQLSLELVSQSLSNAAAAQADAGAGDGGLGQPGGKYILFVTDGKTDFCDDPNEVCPADAVIAEIEKLYGQGIQTRVLSLSSSVTDISVPVLHSFANAGAGIVPLAPPNGPTGPPLLPSDIYNQCNGTPGWKPLFTAAGLSPGQALGTYAAPDASVVNAPLYSPDVTNVMDLTSKIASALNTVKSCSFDLQGKIKVDLPHASSGKVIVDGVAVPYDATNGWTMTTATQLDLVGAACDAWRASGTKIDFAFPCQILISTAL